MTKLTITGDSVEQGGAIALGNFDGLHLGHQAVFDQISARKNWAICSFDPHPSRFFDPQTPRFELMNTQTHNRIANAFGAKSHLINFDANVAHMAPLAFLDALNDYFAPTTLTIGEDFRFGKNRDGDAAVLHDWGLANGVEILVAPLVAGEKGKISSTEIRNALIAGNVTYANQMLGRPHIMNGIVTQGDQRGRDLGYPTANLYPHDVMLPRFGIYGTYITIHDGPFAGRYRGASSLGIRPSFGINKPNFETFILDFDGDIYGREISVELIDYVRGEQKFDDINALIVQMGQDVQNIRTMLTEHVLDNA